MITRLGLKGNISIHAAREGGDQMLPSLAFCADISIHAAREGGDVLQRAFLLHMRISIHAAREGGDLSVARHSAIAASFQSTPPVKAATMKSKSPNRIMLTFQSTPPVKAATMLTRLHLSTPLFQSTPPVKAATEERRKADEELAISIHAAREGGDIKVS